MYIYATKDIKQKRGGLFCAYAFLHYLCIVQTQCPAACMLVHTHAFCKYMAVCQKRDIRRYGHIISLPTMLEDV